MKSLKLFSIAAAALIVGQNAMADLDCTASGKVDSIVRVLIQTDLYNTDNHLATVTRSYDGQMTSITPARNFPGYEGDGLLTLSYEEPVKGRSVLITLERPAANQYIIKKTSSCDIQYDDECVGSAQTPTVVVDTQVSCKQSN